MIPNWMKEIDAAITICDKNFNIIYMNDKSQETFESSKIGDSLLNCHKPESIKLMSELLQQRKTNTYTIEKNSVKKLIHQTPWYENGEVAGFIEFSIVLPTNMQHFVRS